MNRVIHYELGNHDLREQLVVSASRYFRTRRIMHKFETTVLDFFRQLVRVKAGRESLLALFQHARLCFAELLSDPLEADSFRNFQYLYWIDSKIAMFSSSTHGSFPAENTSR
jgi:hypothetical protein